MEQSSGQFSQALFAVSTVIFQNPLLPGYPSMLAQQQLRSFELNVWCQTIHEFTFSIKDQAGNP